MSPRLRSHANPLVNSPGLGYNPRRTGRSSARLERTVRVREAGGSNPPAPTLYQTSEVFEDLRGLFFVAGPISANAQGIAQPG